MPCGEIPAPVSGLAAGPVLDPISDPISDPVETCLASLVAGGEREPGSRLAIDLSAASLERVRHVMARLGNPQEATVPVIHLAGTNGKGSTLAALRAMAEADGRRVHCLTSPHLVATREQIRLAGTLIADDDLIETLKAVHCAADGISLTRFERMTMAAFVAFSRTPADLILLETGLGGRLDATNILRRPLMQIITPISLDHQEFLGATLPQIAREKAGILRHGGLCVSAPQVPEVGRELARAAAQVGSRLIAHGLDWHYDVSGEDGPPPNPPCQAERWQRSACPRPDYQGGVADGSLVVIDGDEAFCGPLPALVGKHQYMNAATAIVAARAMSEHRIADASIRAGLSRMRWPGRLQAMNGLAGYAPDGVKIWLDSGHNPAAAEMIARFLREQGSPAVTLICAMKASKDPAAFFRPFVGLVERVIAVPLWRDQTGYAAAALAREAARFGIPGRCAADLRDALAQAERGNRPTIMIAGSVRLAGEALMLAGLLPD